MHTDPLFYRLFQERPELAFELAGLSVPDAAAYRLRAIEVKQTSFRLDGVLLPPKEREDAPLVFVEAQFQGRRTFYGRWFAAIFLYLYRHRITRPWQALVVFPDHGADNGILAPYQGLIQAGLLQRVYLADLLGVAELGLNARLARLVILDNAAAQAEARALAQARDITTDPLETLDLIETILVYKFPQLTRDEIRAMLQLPITDVKKTRFYQEVFSEGREEGREEAERALILRQLRRRCGPLTPEQETRVGALPSARLGSLGEALLDFRSREDLETWLRQP